jgi:hypothetical protein
MHRVILPCCSSSYTSYLFDLSPLRSAYRGPTLTFPVACYRGRAVPSPRSYRPVIENRKVAHGTTAKVSCVVCVNPAPVSPVSHKGAHGKRGESLYGLPRCRRRAASNRWREVMCAGRLRGERTTATWVSPLPFRPKTGMSPK